MIPMILFPPRALLLQGQIICFVFCFLHFWCVKLPHKTLHFCYVKLPHKTTGGISWAQQSDTWMYYKVSMWYLGAKNVSRLPT